MKSPHGYGAWMAKVGEKGQIVIPKEARDQFGINPGDTLLILGDPDQGLAIVSGERMHKLASHIFSGSGQPQTEQKETRDESD